MKTDSMTPQSVIAAIVGSKRPAQEACTIESALGAFVRDRRSALAVRPADLARAAGDRNLAKALRRIAALEAGGRFPAQMLERVAEPLGTTVDRLGALLAEDARRWDVAWDRWADVPQAPYSTFRIPGGELASPLPERVESMAAAVAHTRDLARRAGRAHRLVWSRRYRVAVAGRGERIRPNNRREWPFLPSDAPTAFLRLVRV